jgi:hypothetical protein
MKGFQNAATVAVFFLTYSSANGQEQTQHSNQDSNEIHHPNRKLFMAEENGIEDQFIVITEETLHSSISGEVDMAKEAESLTTGTGGAVTMTYGNVFHGFVVTGLSQQAAMDLAQDQRVKSVHQDEYIYMNTVGSWGLDRVDQRDLPLDKVYQPNFGNGGKGVTAYVIDTGIQISHEEFGGRARFGMNAIEDSNEDCNGHGTHVAGILGGNTYGVANKVDLVAIKVLDCEGGGSISGIIKGIDFILGDATSPAVANLSLGAGKNELLDTTVKKLVTAGITTVVAAGNENSDACNSSPASEPSVITVASTNEDDARSSFSNWGRCVDIFAPGGQITSAWIGGDSAINTISGTSMSSPHVCGAAALFLAENQDATPSDIEETLLTLSTPNKVRFEGFRSPNELLYVGDDCIDVNGWHDSDGSQFDCEWYSHKDNCEVYGHSYEHMGKTANEACCVCPGAAPTSNPSMSPSESPTENVTLSLNPSASPTGLDDGISFASITSASPGGDNAVYFGVMISTMILSLFVL